MNIQSKNARRPTFCPVHSQHAGWEKRVKRINRSSDASKCVDSLGRRYTNDAKTTGKKKGNGGRGGSKGAVEDKKHKCAASIGIVKFARNEMYFGYLRLNQGRHFQATGCE